MKMDKILNYIGGKFQEPASKEYFDSINPATAEIIFKIPDSDERDVENAYKAAKEAFPMWSNMPVQERSKWLLKLSSAIENKLEDLALAESKDNGKPLALAKAVDIPRAAANFHFYGTAILHFATEAHEMATPAINYTSRKPIGVVGCISPWNLPLYLFSWKIAPALAAGNTLVAKPSEITPLTAYLLSEICQEIGFPTGVLNIVHGYGHKVGQAIVEHTDIPAISFTGGTATGKRIASIAAPMFKKLSLELGGKNPTIIFEDCDFEETIKNVVNASFRNQGQICLCGSRILIQESIYEKFKAAFVEATSQLKVGDPLEEGNDMGALVSKAHFEKVTSHIKIAKEEGGYIIFGGNQLQLEGRCSNGYFLEPTIIEGLDGNCATNQQEIFGPVVTIMPFKTEEEAVEIANSTSYGLAASIWTTHLNRAHQVAHALESGIVWVNCWMLRDLRTPFGGVKNSGIGREGGFEALKFFTEEKNICVKF